MRIKNLIAKLRPTLLVSIAGALVVSAPGGLSMALAQPKPSNGPSIIWSACPDLGFPSGALECGTLEVPLNYNNPSGEKIKVAVSRLKAQNPSLRQGVLLLNPGGPGGSGFDMPLEMAQLMPASVLDRYDLIGFDPRGVGYSAPVSCGLTAVESAQIAPPIEQQANFDATATFMQRVANGCAAHSGAHLPHITTTNTARDMDRIRQALGEAKISFFGYSYGTYLGGVYATLFPQKADRFILDSATQPRGAWREQFRNWKFTDQVRFPDFGRFLIEHESEYGLGGSQAEVRQTFFDLVDQLNAEPVPLGDGVLVDGGWFRVLTFSGLYSDSYFPEIAQFWKLIKDLGSTTEMRALAQSLNPRLLSDFPAVPRDNNAAATNAVLCDDFAWSRSVEQYRQELNADNAQSPMFAKVGSHIWPCAFWPNNPVEQPVTVGPLGPSNKILIVQNLRDPATPYFGAVEMRARFGQRAKLVTVVQGGHGASYGENNACAKDTVTNYLVNGIFPTNDFVCPAESGTPGSQPFAASSAEYQAMKTLRHRMW